MPCNCSHCRQLGDSNLLKVAELEAENAELRTQLAKTALPTVEELHGIWAETAPKPAPKRTPRTRTSTRTRKAKTP